jgi:hypothetical protein
VADIGWRGPELTPSSPREVTVSIRISVGGLEQVGARRVQAKLVASGIHVGRKRVGRLMHQARLPGASRRKLMCTTSGDEDARPAPIGWGADISASRPGRASASRAALDAVPRLPREAIQDPARAVS